MMNPVVMCFETLACVVEKTAPAVSAFRYYPYVMTVKLFLHIYILLTTFLYIAVV